ncbi:phage tail protein [Leuconostoc carnosum]|uniref:phage tail protein n=1 Tax=Leuconostoc carnosum TaxID=1252 RepID=UPI00123871C0|nr:phage tail protein [Leuconostoc carnosum]KAA8372363.1 hypothetical protein FE412_07325 [Leuconostoc carnosum]
MATQGIVTSYFGIIDNKTGQLVKGTDGLSTDGLYEADGHEEATAEGATQIQIQGLDTAPTPQFSNNKSKRSTQSTPFPTAEFTMLDLSFAAKQKLLGKKLNAKGFFTKGSSDETHVAAIAVTRTLDKQHLIYYAFANGVLTEGNKTLATNTQTEADSNDVMTLTTFSPIVDEQFDGDAYTTASDLIPTFKFDDLLAETFPGYTKVPADGQG